MTRTERSAPRWRGWCASASWLVLAVGVMAGACGGEADGVGDAVVPTPDGAVADVALADVQPEDLGGEDLVSGELPPPVDVGPDGAEGDVAATEDAATDGAEPADVPAPLDTAPLDTTLEVADGGPDPLDGGGADGGPEDASSDAGDTTEPEPEPEPEELVFLRIDGAVQGLISGWHNPWPILGDTSLEDYAWVEAHTLTTLFVQGTGSSQSNGRVAHEPLALTTRWSAGPIGVLSALVGNETMTLDILTFRRQANAEYTLTRLYTLTDTVSMEVALETTDDDGALVTRSTLRFHVVSLGITDYASNLSYEWP